MKQTLSTDRFEYWEAKGKRFRKCLKSGKWQIKRDTGWETMKKLKFTAPASR